MEKIKSLISNYGRWQPLSRYVERIEAHIDTDFSLAFENAKSLIESICREICEVKNTALGKKETTKSLLQKSFSSFGYSNSQIVTNVASSFANIGKHLGGLRNDIGSSSHGKSMADLATRDEQIDNLTKEFLIDSITVVACFLIKNLEGDSPRVAKSEFEDFQIAYDAENDDESKRFNEYWDDIYGTFSMGGYSFLASEVFHAVDYNDYMIERHEFLSGEEE